MKTLEYYLQDLSGKSIRYMSIEIREEINILTFNCSGNLRERLYWLRNNLIEYPKCKYCHKELTSTNFINNGKAGYRNYCGIKCSKLDQEYDLITSKRKETNIEKYGSNNPWYFKKFREYIRDKYGIEFNIEEANDG